MRVPGKNAYYYAHAHSADAPKWDGAEAPRLLEKAAPKVDDAPALRKLAKYAWGDEAGKVRAVRS